MTMKKYYQAPSTKVHFGGLETAGSLLTTSSEIASPDPSSDKTLKPGSARSKRWQSDDPEMIWE